MLVNEVYCSACLALAHLAAHTGLHVQACVTALAEASVSSWKTWYIPDSPFDHTSVTTVLVAVAALSLKPTNTTVRKLAELSASALESNLECSAMRSPTMSPTSDIVDLVQAFSRIFGVNRADSINSADMMPNTCSTHYTPFNQDLVDEGQVGMINSKQAGNHATDDVPVWPAYERVPADVRTFTNTACEELRMRVLPAVHNIHPPAKPKEIVALLSGMPLCS